MKKPQKSAGRKAETGNVVVDLGEKHHARIDKMIQSKLAAAGVTGRTEVGKSSLFRGSKLGTPGKFRPGALQGGFRPWYARHGRSGSTSGRLGNRFGRPAVGQGFAFAPRSWGFIPSSISSVKTSQVLTGLGLGILGNRALARIVPSLWQGVSSLTANGVAFAAGLIPLLFKRNATTFGVALPGTVLLGSALVDSLFNWIGMPSAMAGGMRGVDGTSAARQKLQAMQQRINTGGVRAPLPQVFARPQVA